ncbi:MAG TPA: DUF4154 domain-containing protein [Geobacter sp.]|nr:DUF4154 domain-containing protein [Geobacter sp.]
MLIGAALALFPSTEPRADLPQEYQVKAAMVFNIAKYVEWPTESLAAGSSPLIVCSIGRGPFAAALERYQGKTAMGHPLALRRLAPGEEPGECHVLVISGIEKRYLAGILEQARKRPVLSVSDLPDFAQAGGIIGLVEQEGKVRFEINMKTARQSRVKISSQLLKLSRILREGE